MNTFLLIFSPSQWIFIGITFFLFVVTTLYLFILYYHPSFHKIRVQRDDGRIWPSVSVVLCATNEYKMLRRMLPVLLTQDYPCYEVVVVNDRSQDNSEILLRTLQDKYPHLQSRTTSTDDRFGRSPALAIGMGIRAAQYDTILCIEADCLIKDSQWIRSMATPYGGNCEIVLGHTTHYKCSLLQRCDLLLHALHYMGRAAVKRPYFGIGSNLLFKKSLFYDNNGFNVRLTRGHFPLSVFFGEVAKRNNCDICTIPSGVNHSRVKLNGKMWTIYLKMRNRSIAMSPKSTKHPMLLESTLRLFFYLAITVAIFLYVHKISLLLIFYSMLFFRLLMVFLVYRDIRKKLDDKGLAFPFLCWDVLFPIINIYRFFR